MNKGESGGNLYWGSICQSTSDKCVVDDITVAASVATADM